MAHINPETVAKRVSAALNLTISGESRAGKIDIRIDGLERPHGFKVVVSAGLSFAYAELMLDSLAKDIVTAVDACSRDDWRQMVDVRSAFSKLGIEIEVRVNGHAISGDPLELPSNVEAIAVSAKSNMGERSPSEVAGDAASAVIATLFALLPIDDPDNEAGAMRFDPDVEGAISKHEANVYERSRANRAVAIALHGTTCKVCDINFGERYGELGLGYIEIHHLNPVSLMGGQRAVDPSSDLVPLCANCHRMAHRTNPPVAPEHLRELMDPAEPV